MVKYITLLRGINVGGNRKILMTDLKVLFEEFGFSNVNTYIQSGNIIFENAYKLSPNKLEIKITNTIQNKYKFEVEALVIPLKEMEKAFRENPFLKNKKFKKEHLHLTILKQIPLNDNIEQLKNNENASSGEYQIKGRMIYLHYPYGYGKTRLNNNFFERKLKRPATTRNWKTITKLIEISNS